MGEPSRLTNPVAHLVGLGEDRGPRALRLRDADVHVRDLQANVDHAVAVLGVMRDQRAVGRNGALDDEPDGPGTQDERLVVPVAGLRPRVGDEFHTPHRLVVVRRHRRVADDKDDRVPAGDRERIGAGVVVDQTHQLLELAQVQTRLGLLLGQGRASVNSIVRHKPRVPGGGQSAQHVAKRVRISPSELAIQPT